MVKVAGVPFAGKVGSKLDNAAGRVGSKVDDLADNAGSATKSRGAGPGVGEPYAKQVLPGGRTDVTTIAGHGEFKVGSGYGVVPDGTELWRPIGHDATMSDSFGRAIENGSYPANSDLYDVFKAGDSYPDYRIKPPSKLTIFENSISVDAATHLSQILKKDMGVCILATCTEVVR